MRYEDLAKMIDHSILQPNSTRDDFEIGCRLALAYDVASVCIVPHYLKRCAELLAGNTVKASTVIGFPHGGHVTSIKAAEAKQAIIDGGEELDMVANISRVLSGDWAYVRDDIAAVIDTAHAAGAKVKVIFENCYLNDEHRIRLCQLCGELNADWVKTSTGYGSSGATPEDIALMRKHSPARVQVKAAGGVRDVDMLIKVRELGASRCGTSKTKELLDEARKRFGLDPVKFDAKVVAGTY
jgi:deoxyribose-phosphate aldolase